MRRGHNLQTSGVSHPAQILNRNVLDDINFTRKQGRNAGRGGLNRGVDDFAHLVRVNVCAPVVRVRLQDSLFVDCTADEHERTGTVGVRGRIGRLTRIVVKRLSDVIGLGPALVHHEGVGEVVDHQRVRTLGLKINGVGVNGANIDHRSKQFLHLGGIGLSAVQREHHVLGIKGSAVVEGHAFAELEAPYIRVTRQGRPLGCQRRDDCAGHVALQQRIINLVCQSVGWALVLRVRIKRQRVTGARPADGLSRGRRNGQAQGCSS